MDKIVTKIEKIGNGWNQSTVQYTGRVDWVVSTLPMFMVCAWPLSIASILDTRWTRDSAKTSARAHP